jgi:hypothetical protein
MYASSFELECNEDEYGKEPVDVAIQVMHKLHTLELYDCDLSVEGLNGILDSCPLLETLHIDGYFDKRKMDEELRLKCTRVKNLKLDTRKRPHNCIGTLVVILQRNVVRQRKVLKPVFRRMTTPTVQRTNDRLYILGR